MIGLWNSSKQDWALGLLGNRRQVVGDFQGIDMVIRDLQCCYILISGEIFCHHDSFVHHFVDNRFQNITILGVN